MSDVHIVVGSFADEDQCARAIEAARHANLGAIRAFAPVPSEHISEALEQERSPVRVFVLIAGIVGAISGFALTIGTSLTYPHIVGGKPLVSIPPYVIIAFELMILFGALTGAITFLLFARLPAFDPLAGYASRFAGDRFGLAVRCSGEDRDRVEAMLRESGAEEITVEAA